MKIALFPAGRDAGRIYGILQSTGEHEIICFADNNANLIGKPYNKNVDIKVVSPHRLKSYVNDGKVDRVLVCSSAMLSYRIDELTSQLDELGIMNYSVVPSYIFRKQELDAKDLENIFTPKGKLNQLQHLQFHVADNCNMKCRRCQHFSNVVEGNRFPEFESVKRDFDRLAELFDNINSIALLGGEPLLNKELPKYCFMVRKAFPYSAIEIITNGLLVRQMSEELISAIKENNILVNISYYPPLVPVVDEVAGFLIENNIRYTFGPKVDKFSKKMTLDNLSDPEEQFRKCRDRCCTMLRDGKLYPCYLPATIEFFNNEYDTEIPCNDSSIDIYREDITGLQILERLKHGFDICRYCTEDVILPWERADRSAACASDWIV